MSTRTTFGRRGLPAAAQAPAPKRAPFPEQTPPPPEFHYHDDPGFEHADPGFEPDPRSVRATEQNGVAWLLFSLQGRITRGTYRLSRFGLIAVYLLITAAGQAVRGALDARATHTLSDLAGPSIGLLLTLFSLGLAFWISFALTVKRWHDRDRPWAFALLGFVPVIGWLWQWIECGRMEGTLGPNRFGPSPKGIVSVTYVDDYAETFS
jgi:uncharacterized membrane protein YhaH (DUF805 family)